MYMGYRVVFRTGSYQCRRNKYDLFWTFVGLRVVVILLIYNSIQVFYFTFFNTMYFGGLLRVSVGQLTFIGLCFLMMR